MLKAFRDNLKYLSWVLWIVIAVFILFVFADFGSIRLGGGAPSDSAATVGKHKISYAEFQRTYRETEDYYRQTYGEQFNRELAQQIGLPLQVLDQLIAEKILTAEADRMGLRVTDQEVARVISELPVFQLADGGFIGEERYNQVLRSYGYTVEQFEESMRADLLNGKVRSVLSQNLYVSDDEVIDDYKRRIETANIRYLRLPSDRLRDEVVITDEEVQSYFSEHQEEFRIPERRVVDYLLVDPDLLRSEIELADSELRAYYDDNPDEFSQDEQVRARHILLQVSEARPEEVAEGQLQQIRSRLEAGEDFAALAAQLSDDPGSKTQGGDLGFFGRGQMIPEFETAAFEAQPGELVGPIRTSFGYHLIEVLEKRPAGRTSFDQAQEQIRSRLLAERSRSLVEIKARELAERVRSEQIDSAEAFRALADAEPGVTAHTTSPFGREDNVPGIGRGTSFTVTAFELARGDSSEAISIPTGWTILRLAEINEPRIPELASVQNEVREALRSERQLELAKSRLTEAGKSIREGRTLDEVATELGVSIQESGEFRRLGSIPGLGSVPELNAAALALDQGQVGGPVVHNRDVILFEVSDRQRYDPNQFEQEKEQARENLRQQRLGQILASLISQRRDELGVRYDPQLLRNFELTAGAG